MQISQIIRELETYAPGIYQESYDNSGLLCGDPNQECTGVVVALDATLPVVEEALERGANLIVAHHPIVFKGLKKLTGGDYVEKTLIKAIRHEIAILAVHTNLDNIQQGVNGKIASMLGLENIQILSPRPGTLRKLYCFVPDAQFEKVREAVFAAGAGHIGGYSECSFAVPGKGSFRPGLGTNPFSGTIGMRQEENETRLECIYPVHLEAAIVQALLQAHPYEEVAYDLVPLTNVSPLVGAGMSGVFKEAMDEKEFLDLLKTVFRIPVIRHTRLLEKPVRKIAFCGGAGSFLINSALRINCDAYVTADLKYHEFFDANDRLLLADVGHFESEQYTIALLYDILAEKFPNFAVFKTRVSTNPVNYYR